jgi:hypothetical protein
MRWLRRERVAGLVAVAIVMTPATHYDFGPSILVGMKKWNFSKGAWLMS